MDQKSIALLEFPKVRHQLVDFASFPASKDLAAELHPSRDSKIVSKALRETTEACSLLGAEPILVESTDRDVRNVLARADRGVRLDPVELLDVKMTLQVAQRVKSTLRQHQDSTPLLATRTGQINPCQQLQDAIQRSVGDNAEVLDTSSRALGRIRGSLRAIRRRLVAACNRLTGGAQRSLLQEPQVTIRSQRYVVPVKYENRLKFAGIVHDQSASGATVFMEPLELVDLNNHWRQVQVDEQKEVDRVLLRLSALVTEHRHAISQAVLILAAVDFSLAKARYAVAINAVCPNITEATWLRLVDARHPLLGRSAIPLSAELGLMDSTSTAYHWGLVITGPNTGGKTVSLKTIGLLSQMVQAGLYVPVGEGSAFPVWDDILVDIGDEQSLEQSLSTFSSHMTGIVRILEHATRRTLVLLDEIGVGTDPEEGSALAHAILSDLAGRHICTVVTTHYADLKAYAAEHPRLCNGNMEFNLNSLRPTFRFRMGLPGPSYGLAVAEQLGLPDRVLREARESINPETRQVQDLLESIESGWRDAHEARQAATDSRNAALQLQADLKERLDQFKDERKRLLDHARAEAEDVLNDARRALHRVLHAVTEKTPLKHEQVTVADRAITAAASRVTTLSGITLDRRETPVFISGDWVRVPRLNTSGQVISMTTDQSEADVQLGSLRTRILVADLVHTTKRGDGASRSTGMFVESSTLPRSHSPSVRMPSVEHDVRGRRVSVALSELERYLDDAHRSNMSLVRIVHGKGTGALREAIRDWLSEHPLVREINPAYLLHGGDGATEVHLV